MSLQRSRRTEYVYNAATHRIRKTVSNGGLSGNVSNGETNFVYNSGWQCLEERDDADALLRQYVWGIYIDELLQMREGSSDRYPLQDLLYRTTALTDASGAIAETYDTDAYGNTLIFDSPGTGGDWWADDAQQGDVPMCAFIFTGRRYDAEAEVYQYRHRCYAPVWGRFVTRDPAGFVDGLNQYLGLFSMKGGLDAHGLVCGDCQPPPKSSDNVYDIRVADIRATPGAGAPSLFEAGKSIQDNLAKIGMVGLGGGVISSTTKGLTKSLSQQAIMSGASTYAENSAKVLVKTQGPSGSEVIDAVAGAWSGQQGYGVWVKLEYDSCVPCTSLNPAKWGCDTYEWVTKDTGWQQCKQGTASHGLYGGQEALGQSHPTPQNLAECVRQIASEL